MLLYSSNFAVLNGTKAGLAAATNFYRNFPSKNWPYLQEAFGQEFIKGKKEKEENVFKGKERIERIMLPR